MFKCLLGLVLKFSGVDFAVGLRSFRRSDAVVRVQEWSFRCPAAFIWSFV